MPKRGVDYCIEVMEFLKRKGFTTECPTAEVYRAIMLLVGMTNRVRLRYMENLQTLGFVEPQDNGICKLNMDKVYELQLK